MPPYRTNSTGRFPVRKMTGRKTARTIQNTSKCRRKKADNLFVTLRPPDWGDVWLNVFVKPDDWAVRLSFMELADGGNYNLNEGATTGLTVENNTSIYAP